MKYLKRFNEGINNYDPTPDTSPKLTDYRQGEINGLEGTWNNDADWKKIEDPLDNEVKRIRTDMNKDADNGGIMDMDKIKKKRFHGFKIKDLKKKTK
jgi:hypothetical protein